jgi:hypothetical protein
MSIRPGGKAWGNILGGGGIVSFFDLADPGFVSGDGLLGLVTAILRLIAYSALGAVALGFAATVCWCLFDGGKWRACEGRSLFWRLMH